MIDFLKSNVFFLGMITLWMLVGAFTTPLAYILIPGSILLLKSRGMYLELLMGFLVILLLSDSRAHGFSFTKNMRLIYLPIMFVFILFDSKEFKFENPILRYYFLLILYAFILVFISDERMLSLQKTLSYALFIYTVPIYVRKLLNEQKEVFLKSLVYFGLTFLCIGFVIVPLFPGSAFDHNDFRFAGAMGNPNGIGLFCFLYYLMYRSITAYKKTLFTRQEMYFINAMILLSVVLSDSRNSTFSILLLMFFDRTFKLSRLWGFITFLFLIAAYFFIEAHMDQIISMLSQYKLFRAETLATGSGRLVAWKFAWNEAQYNLFFGKGIGYEEHLFFIHQKALNLLGHQGGVHNTYLAFLLNTGIVGVLLFLWAVFSVLIKASKRTHIAYAMLYSAIFSLTFETWMVGSINAYHIFYIIAVSLLSCDEFWYVPEEQTLPVSR